MFTKPDRASQRGEENQARKDSPSWAEVMRKATRGVLKDRLASEPLSEENESRLQAYARETT